LTNEFKKIFDIKRGLPSCGESSKEFWIVAEQLVVSKSNGFIGTQIEAMQIMWSVLRVNGQVPNVQK
jgi:hypothetical protein